MSIRLNERAGFHCHPEGLSANRVHWERGRPARNERVARISFPVLNIKNFAPAARLRAGRPRSQ